MMPSQNPPPRRFGRTMAWGLAVTLGAVVLRELTRPRAARGRLIDWDHIEAQALRRCGEGSEPAIDPLAVHAYETMALELAPSLDQAFGPPSSGATGALYPPLRPVGRREWVRFNVRIFRRMFQPLERLEELLPGSLLMRWSEEVITRYMGLLLGLLARRVLGQYDPALLGREPPETSTLILVEPNVQAWAKRDSLPLDELRRWLAMHEMTHAWEFRAHPWLQGYFEGLLRQVLVGGLADGHRPSSWELIRTLTFGMRQQWRAVSRIQAAMSLLEGFSNLIMNDVGRRQLPHFALLERAYRRRLENRTPLEQLFMRLTGLEMKIQQYILGERFASAIRDAGGMELLANVWRGPEWLPTMQEIQNPERWIARVRQAA